MPNGKTHDIVTLLLAPAAGLASYVLTRDAWLTCLVAAAFVFGGLMFGPDLDTNSKQLARWTLLRPIWFPYRTFFSHRSRWTHGLLFGSLIRVGYFMGVLTIGAFAAAFLVTTYTGGKLPSLTEFGREWQHLGAIIGAQGGWRLIISLFVGIWAGAASHTFTDLAGTYIKSGRVGKTL
jgi:uncharacterized metal-binding protein